jgi:hypothetical protein
MRRLGVGSGLRRLRAWGDVPCALGRFWVTVRPHYGGLPLKLAGRGIGERRETVGIGGVRSSAPLPGRTVPGTEIAAVVRREALRGCSLPAFRWSGSR